MQQKAADIYESLTNAALECKLNHQLGSMMQEQGTRGQRIVLHGAVASPNDSSPIPTEQRTRFLMRLLTSHVDAVSDCELLELVLSSAPCTVDANALAIRLLERFGTLNKVMHADADTLRSIEGIDDAVLKALAVMRLTAQRMVKSTITEQPVIHSWSRLIDYLKIASGHSKVEEFRILFLNNRHMLIADEVMQRGTINHTPIYPREIVKRALELSATGVIIAHNHPSGDCTPSKADIEITLKIMEAAAGVGVVLHDHVIVTEAHNYSFRSLGLLRDAGAVAVNAAVVAAEPTQVQFDLF